MKCHVQEWQLLLSYFWSYIPFLCLTLISCPLCNKNTLWNILMIFEVDEVMCTRKTTLALLLLALSPFVIFDSDYALISCPLCK